MALKDTIGSACRGGRMMAHALSMSLIAACAADMAEASEVTLRVKGGGLEVKGELKSFDGLKYVVETPQVGLMTFDAARVDCVGEACSRRVAPAALPLEPLSAATPETVSIKGAGVMVEGLLPALIKGYAAGLGAVVTPIVGTTPTETKLRLSDTKGAELATFVMQRDSAAAGVAALTQSAAEIALSDRPMTEQEVQALAAAFPESKSQSENLVASDGVAIIVSPDNPTLALSDDAIARIFAGRVAIDVGVSGSRFHIYTNGADSSAVAALTASILKPRGMTLAPIAAELASEAAVADAVARDPNGIGIVSFAFQRNAKRLNIESACGIITRPTSFAVKAGEYALSRRLYLVTTGQPKSAAARGLIRYAMSKDAQPVISEAQFIDRLPETLAIDEQTGRMGAALNAPPQAFDMDEMRKLLADLRGTRRLSLTFRFTPGSIDLDPASRREVAHLAELLQTPEYSARPVQLIGFTEAEGKFSVALASSAKRAAQLKSALAAAGGKLVNAGNIVPKGYGPLAPIICNDTAEHRHINRRIEVWVKD